MFTIRIGNKYLKFTSNFGMYHGSAVLTEDAGLAKKYSRKADAERKAWILTHQLSQKYNRVTRKNPECAGLSAEVVEID